MARVTRSGFTLRPAQFNTYVLSIAVVTSRWPNVSMTVQMPFADAIQDPGLEPFRRQRSSTARQPVWQSSAAGTAPGLLREVMPSPRRNLERRDYSARR
jgi:hypothetical protein